MVLWKELIVSVSDGCWYSLGCCVSREGSILLCGGPLTGEVLSSLELLNNKQWHTELQFGCHVAVVGGVVGLREMFSLVETW